MWNYTAIVGRKMYKFLGGEAHYQEMDIGATVTS
jgi:hypothetical protein